MPSDIKKCTCVHPFQDERYGHGNRVHNQAVKDRTVRWRCSVCADVKDGIKIQPREEKGSDA